MDWESQYKHTGSWLKPTEYFQESGEIEYHIHMGDPSISIYGENTPQDG